MVLALLFFSSSVTVRVRVPASFKTSHDLISFQSKDNVTSHFLVLSSDQVAISSHQIVSLSSPIITSFH
jgi:hypothetical protein